MEDETYVAAYEESRKELLCAERLNAWDRCARPKIGSLSEQEEVEKRAAIIIRAIREYERTVTFGNIASEALPGVEDLDMGGQYLTNKERIDTKSELFKISKMVPKGALLHLHFNAELYPEILLVRARKMENMYIRSTQRIQDESQLGTTELIFSVLDPTTIKSDVSIFSEDYPLITELDDMKEDEFQKIVWMSWARFQDEFEKRFPEKYKDQELETSREGRPHSCGDSPRHNLRPAENWLRSKMVLSQEEVYHPGQTVNGYIPPYST